MVIYDWEGATAGLSSSVARRDGSALLDKPAVAPNFHKIRYLNSETPQ